MSAEAGYAQTASGIIIPAQTLDRLHRTIVKQEFVKLTRLLTFAKANGMKALFTCDTCNMPIAFQHHDQIVTEIEDRKGRKSPAGGGRFSLQCGCTTWDIR